MSFYVPTHREEVLLERIAELEAESERLDALLEQSEERVGTLYHRIAELEADANLLVHLHAFAIEQGYMPDPGESAYDLLQRALMTKSPAALKVLRDSHE